ncbi:MAG: hypothetical protein EPN30_01930 [Actinomycetota bacterium]|nr:MAG: hypothetical protein EPN30_01930 [Actinomycetota bacterium]
MLAIVAASVVVTDLVANPRFGTPIYTRKSPSSSCTNDLFGLSTLFVAALEAQPAAQDGSGGSSKSLNPTALLVASRHNELLGYSPDHDEAADAVMINLPTDLRRPGHRE